MRKARFTRLLIAACVFVTFVSAADIPSAADLRAQGDKSFAAGVYDAAMTSFQAAAKLEPAFPGGQYRIAQTALRLKQPKVGLEALDAITLLDPKIASNEAIVKLRDDLKALNPEVAAASRPSMSAEDRLELDTLSLLYDKAQAAKDTKERTDLLKQFMDRSAKFVSAHPDEAKIWAYRGAIALELDSAKDGWEAGKNLKRLGGLNGGDDPAKKVLIALNAKGWFADDYATVQRQLVESRLKAWEGKWTGEASGPSSAKGWNDKGELSYTTDGTTHISVILTVTIRQDGSFEARFEGANQEVLETRRPKGETTRGEKVLQFSAPGEYFATDSRSSMPPVRQPIELGQAIFSEDRRTLSLFYSGGGNDAIVFQIDADAKRVYIVGGTIAASHYGNFGSQYFGRAPLTEIELDAIVQHTRYEMKNSTFEASGPICLVLTRSR